MRLWRGLGRAWAGLSRLRQRAAKRSYGLDGKGYEQVQSHFTQRQRDEVEAREAGAKKQQRLGSPTRARA